MRRSTWAMTLALVFTLRAIEACETLSAEDAWIREPPPQAHVAAGYVRLINTSDEAVTIERIDSDCCDHVMVHDSVYSDGRARMVHVEHIEIGARSETLLAPGGMHPMLMKLAERPRHGEHIAIDFTCKDATTTIDFPVINAR